MGQKRGPNHHFQEYRAKITPNCKQIYIGYRPINPPGEFGTGEFGTTPAPSFLQTPSVVERNIENRNVSARARAKRTKLDDNKCDLIECWDDLEIYCRGHSLVCDLWDSVINLYCIDGTPPSIIYSISISDVMKLSAFKYNSVVNICDVVPSLDWKICRYSELDNIIEKLRTFPINVQTEIKTYCGYTSYSMR